METTAIKYSAPSIQQPQRMLTRKLMQLHDSGYTFDFTFIGTKKIICLQEDLCFLLAHVTVREVYKAYDTYSHNKTLIHTVDTYCGYQGLVITKTSNELVKL